MDAGSHLLYILLDSNLPTGGFIASSGLESWAKHGFLSFDPDPPTSRANGERGRSANASLDEVYGRVNAQGRRPADPSGAAAGVTEFAKAEIENYHSTTGGFVSGAWEVVHGYLRSSTSDGKAGATREDREGVNENHEKSVLEGLLRLDRYHEASMLSHVSRRASKAQGVAMLTLYTKGLSRPPSAASEGSASAAGSGEDRARRLVDVYKLLIRKGTAPGHLAVCWGIMTAALGISIEQTIHLHLFLHARSLLSAAVRLNLIGPYLSSQLLLHPFKNMIDRAASADIPSAMPSLGSCAGNSSVMYVDKSEGTREETGGADPWGWTEEAETGPATTWPLGELLMARHDLQHSRIFNS